MSQKVSRQTNLNKVAEIIKKREEKAFKYDCLMKKLEEDANTFKRENSDGSLQNYVQELVEIMKGI